MVNLQELAVAAMCAEQDSWFLQGHPEVSWQSARVKRVVLSV